MVHELGIDAADDVEVVTGQLEVADPDRGPRRSRPVRTRIARTTGHQPGERKAPLTSWSSTMIG